MSIWWRPRGCVLWLDFAELSGSTVYDLSGNGNHGTIHGATWRRGPLIGSLYFDGVDDYVEVPDSPELRIAGELTVEALAYPIAYVNSPYQNIVVTKGSGGTLNYRIGYLNDGWEFRIYVAGAVQKLHVVKPVGRWYHLVGTFDLSVMRFYINGKLEASLEVSGTPATSSEPVRIGWGETSTAPEYFYGSIALIRIYNHALSQEEIETHYRYLMGRVNRIRRRFTE